jgi:hypothetical protein
MKWRAIFETASYKALFGAPDEKTWTYLLPGNADLVVNRAMSKSYVAIRSDEEKKAIEKDIREYIAEGKGMVKSEEVGGDFVYPYKTYLVIAQRKN